MNKAIPKLYLSFVVALLSLSGCNSNHNALSKNSGDSPEIVLIDSLQNQAETLYKAGNFASGNQINEVTNSLCQKINYYQGKLVYKKLKALQLRHDKKFEEATILLVSIENDPRANANLLSDVAFALGDIYTNTGEKELGYNYYIKALNLAEKGKNVFQLKKSYYKTGKALYAGQQYEISRKYFLKSLFLYKEKMDSFSNNYKIQELYNLIGTTYQETDKLDSAMVYYDSAIQFLGRIPVENIKGLTLEEVDASIKKQKWAKVEARAEIDGNIGRIYLTRKKFDSAGFYLRKDIFTNLRSKEHSGHALSSLRYLAAMYYAVDSLDKCKNTLDKLTVATDSLKNHELDESILRLKARYYNKIGDANQAYIYLQKYLDADADRKNHFYEQDFNTALTTNELSEKGQAIKQLSLINEEQQAKVKNSYLIAILLGIIVLVALFWTLLYMRSNKRLRTLNKRITGQKKELEVAHQDLEKANTDLEILDKEKTHILGVVAHDLRNPIDGIEGIIYLLRHENFYKTANGKKMVDYMQQLCEKSRRTISDLIEVAQLNNDQQLEVETKEINSIIVESVLQLQKIAEGKGIEIHQEIPEEKIYSKINEPKFVRVLDNLLTNAIKFTNKGGRIEIQLSGTAQFVHITIKDNGIGMNNDQLNVLFDRFTKAGREGTRGEKSLGLGMSIVKSIVEQHHGKIYVQSTEGEGTSVVVELARV